MLDMPDIMYLWWREPVEKNVPMEANSGSSQPRSSSRMGSSFGSGDFHGEINKTEFQT